MLLNIFGKEDDRGQYQKDLKKMPDSLNDSDEEQDDDVPIEMGGIKSGFSYNDEENAEAIDINNFMKNEPKKRKSEALLD